MVKEEPNPSPTHISQLPICPVNNQSPVPLYHQINLDLKRLIEIGILSPGSLLPPETELCQAYGVSRQTVRQALAHLVDDNLVERFAGRGTFVRSQSERASFHLDRSFSQFIRGLNLVPHSRTIAADIGVVNKDSPRPLHKYLGKPTLHLERVRYGSNEPICHQNTIVLTESCPNLDRFDFEKESLYEILASKSGLTIVRIDHLVRAVAADDYRADLLHIPHGSPLLAVQTVAFLDNNDIIETTYSYYRADRYEFRISEAR
ncbi:MAG TPA: GntR family transcriptional regulator [Anaerolineales bacterium]|nr:GntR family transcriptional regulator [Anaerolineales bacterium]